MKLKSPRRIRLKPLETGQVWRMQDSNLEVDLVGKLLVHYKLIKAQAKRTPTSISGIAAVEKYLKTNKAILIREQPSISRSPLSPPQCNYHRGGSRPSVASVRKRGRR